MYIFKNKPESKLPNEKVTHNSSIATKTLLPILKITHGEFVNIKKERDLLFINNKSHDIKDCRLKDVVDVLTNQGINCLIVNNTKYLNIPVSFLLDFNNISSTVESLLNFVIVFSHNKLFLIPYSMRILNNIN